MPTDHIAVLDKQITALSDALAQLGRGTDLRELLRIIRFPGWTTPAEMLFTTAILESMQAQVALLSRQGAALLAAGKQVSAKQLA